jgi:hypothetical protein
MISFSALSALSFVGLFSAAQLSVIPKVMTVRRTKKLISNFRI